MYTRSELNKPYLMGNVINFESRHMFKWWWIDKRWYDGVPSTKLDHGFPPRPTSQLAQEGAH